MIPFRRLRALGVHLRSGRHRAPELSVEDELFAERLTELLRDYVEAEIPDASVPAFQLPGKTL